MIKISATYNKIVTIIETEINVVKGEIKEGMSRVFSFKTKKSFFDYAANQESMNVRTSQNASGFQKKMELLGFSVQSTTEGCFDWETKFYCYK